MVWVITRRRGYPQNAGVLVVLVCTDYISVINYCLEWKPHDSLLMVTSHFYMIASNDMETKNVPKQPVVNEQTLELLVI